MAEGKPLEGLAKLEDASRLEPDSAAYRIAYLQARDDHARALIARAETARAQSRLEDAERAYREVLLVRAQQDRALEGLRTLDQQRRWDAAAKEAGSAVERRDWEFARTRLKTVLAESPQHPVAVKLMQEIERQTSRPTAAPALGSGYKQPITIEFKDVPLRTVFEVISRTSHLNFLFDKEVKTDQRTSIYLRNSTVEAAVNWLLLTNQLEQRVLDGSSVLVYPATAAKQREYQPLTVKSFYLANAEAKTVANTLKTVLKSKDVVVDEKLNLVILRDSPEAARLAEKLVALHDVPEPEVMLEVEILEVKRDRLLDLGIRWPDQVGLTLLPSFVDGGLTLEDFRGRPARSSVGVSVGSTSILAKKTDADSNILANPRIRARNHEKAKILIGERVPSITTTSTSTGFVGESVSYVEVGLKLEVEPAIYLDNDVAIKVALEVSSIISQQQTKSGSLAYEIGTRMAQTVLRLKDGETQVLAGLINSEDRRTANKVPGLGELPVIGRIFGEQADNTNKTEIVLSITPRVLRNVQRPEANILEFDSGTDASLRAWPADTGNGQPVSLTSAPPPAQQSGGPISMVSGGGSAPSAQASGMGAMAAGGAAPAVPNVTGVASGAALLRWEGPTQVKTGDTFSVQLTMQSEQPVLNIPLGLSFDPTALQLLSVAEGTFLKGGGAPTNFTQKVDTSGQVLISASRNGTTVGATLPGVLTTLTLKAIAPPSDPTGTPLKIVSVAPTGVSGAKVPLPIPSPFLVKILP